MLFINITKSMKEIRHYYDAKGFLDCLKTATAGHKLYAPTEDGYVHGICWLYENDEYNNHPNEESFEFIPYHKWYCEEDHTWNEGSYLKFSGTNYPDGSMVRVITDQEEVTRLIKQYHDKLHGSAEKRAMRICQIENLFGLRAQEAVEHTGDKWSDVYDVECETNEYGICTFKLYDDYYNIIITLED